MARSHMVSADGMHLTITQFYVCEPRVGGVVLILKW